jgi:hypothetical protein
MQLQKNAKDRIQEQGSFKASEIPNASNVPN